jgi:hypothetical protein
MRLSYDAGAIRRDLMRAGCGLACATGVLAVGPVAWIAWSAAGAAVLFLLFGARVLVRWRTTVTLDDAGISLAPWGGRVDWAALEAVRLRYFPGSRDGSDGWLELVVAGNGRRLRIEQSLDGFDRVLTAATDAARARGLPLSPVTRMNLAAARPEAAWTP